MSGVEPASLLVVVEFQNLLGVWALERVYTAFGQRRLDNFLLVENYDTAGVYLVGS